MKITPTCVPCLLKRCIYEIEMVDPRRAPQIMKELLGLLAEGYGPDACSAVVGTKLHRYVLDMLDEDDIYAALKAASNRVASSLLPRAEALVDGAEDPLHAAALCSIAANVLDFGIEGSASSAESFQAQFDALVAEGFARSDLEAAKPYLRNGARILYFTDNCGEIIFDQLLLRELASRGVSIGLVVKGVPVLSDATREDVDRYGLDRLVETVYDTGPYAVGVDLDVLATQLGPPLDEATLVIAKGMANYESMTERPTLIRPVLFLLRTKCVPVARSIGVDRGSNVAVLQK